MADGYSSYDRRRSHVQSGFECGTAHEVMPLLGCQKDERFEAAIDRAKLVGQNR
ncbi:MAG: hypothetical protein ACAF41_02010 [Leptolyngbya sp. BL-A-14]